MYDELINDFTFSSDNLMFISSINPSTYRKQIDVVNLNTKQIEKNIELDARLDSIAYCEETRLLYGFEHNIRNGMLYSICWENGTIEKISLDNKYCKQIVPGYQEGNPILYISNMYENHNHEGNTITIFDPLDGKIIGEISNVNRVSDFIYDDGHLFVISNREAKAYKINNNNEIEKTINFTRPLSIVKEY